MLNDHLVTYQNNFGSPQQNVIKNDITTSFMSLTKVFHHSKLIMLIVGLVQKLEMSKQVGMPALQLFQ